MLVPDNYSVTFSLVDQFLGVGDSLFKDDFFPSSVFDSCELSEKLIIKKYTVDLVEYYTSSEMAQRLNDYLNLREPSKVGYYPSNIKNRHTLSYRKYDLDDAFDRVSDCITVNIETPDRLHRSFSNNDYNYLFLNKVKDFIKNKGFNISYPAYTQFLATRIK